VLAGIEERFLDCASRQLRGSEVEKQKRRFGSLGMTISGGVEERRKKAKERPAL
jgi:hypothetical protein